VSAAWVAGSVRARLLVAERCLGREGADELAASTSLRDALVKLGRSPYRREIGLELGLAEAQHAVASKTLLDLRLLAGWLPGDALGLLRALAGWYELANLEDRIAYLAGAPLRQPFELGSLAAAWPRAAGAQTLEELRRALAASAWGDPGGETPAGLGVGMRLAWARRAADEAPEVRGLAAGACALLVARELFVIGFPVETLEAAALPLLGPRWADAGTFVRFVQALPADAGWALDGVAGPEELWRAEARWWSRCEQHGHALLRAGLASRSVVVGAVALLACDTHRVVTALEAAGRQGLRGVGEVLDAAA
jgi:hypothetical protein